MAAYGCVYILLVLGVSLRRGEKTLAGARVLLPPRGITNEHEVRPPDLTPTQQATYLGDNTERIKARQCDLEAECVKLEMKRKQVMRLWASSARSHTHTIQRETSDDADIPRVEGWLMIFGGMWAH